MLILFSLKSSAMCRNLRGIFDRPNDINKFHVFSALCVAKLARADPQDSYLLANLASIVSLSKMLSVFRNHSSSR
jgi:hypothetical protein